MKYTLLILALLGIIVSALALREHYRTYGDAPCDINAHWDCGVVNHSSYAMFYGVPVAAVGIGGYLLLGLLALRRAYSWMLPFVTIALVFAVHLADIENYVLGVWCLYCVISLGIISLMTFLNLGTVIVQSLRKPSSA